MLSLLADENLDGNIVRAMLRRLPTLDLARAQEVGLCGEPDPAVLDWAAVQQRVLVTHDVQTVTRFAYERVAAGLAMPGVIEAASTAPIGQVVADLALVAECLEPGDLDRQVLCIPL
jgi:hypothetical protein